MTFQQIMDYYYCYLTSLVCLTIFFWHEAESFPCTKESRRELILDVNVNDGIQRGRFESHSSESKKSLQGLGIHQLIEKMLMNRKRRWLTVTTARPPPEIIFKPWLFAF